MIFIKRNLVLLAASLALLFLTASCTRKVEVRHPNLVRGGRFAYIKQPDGTWLVVTKNTKDLDEAMKRIQPGPASVDKLDLWIITPLESAKR
jgi:hypothetical protein